MDTDEPLMTAKQTTLRRIAELQREGFIAAERTGPLQAVAARYAVAITPAMASLIDPADPGDPIARQFLPDERELAAHPAENADPIGDGLKSPVAGLVHRYPDRVLLKVAGACPVYCRFCFRREMVGPDWGEPLSALNLDRALEYVRANAGIWEVILTGGDPLVLSPRRIAELTAALDDISHVRVVRWHTRVPLVAPERVSYELVRALKPRRATVYVGVHANHPRELTPDAHAALAALVDAGIPLVSQTVLLRGVNDDADTLEALMRAFVEARVTPYYLHHGDLAPGTSHFRTTLAHGQEIMRELRRRLSGLAMPAYVLDIPGAFGKVNAEEARPTDVEGHYVVCDRHGDEHIYEDSCLAMP